MPGYTAKRFKNRYLDQMWWHTAVIPATWEAEVGGPWSEVHVGRVNETLSQKCTQNKRTGGMAQVVKCLI
jgi:hypothetical protein